MLFVSDEGFRRDVQTQKHPDAVELDMELNTEKRTLSFSPALQLITEDQDSNINSNHEDPDSEDAKDRGTSPKINDLSSSEAPTTSRGQRASPLANQYRYDNFVSSKFGVANSKEVIKIGNEDIFIATTWAATCCALWFSAINSAPLMTLVEGLDDVVHVV